MATIGNTYLTLADLYKQQDGNGQVVSDIIEMLAQTNSIMSDMMTQECNDGTKHLTTIRTGLPTGTWRRLYQGVQPTKSTNKQVHDTTGMLEAWSEVDSKLVKLSRNPGQFRLNESQAFLEGLTNQVATAIFYGNTDTDPEQFMGLAPRFNELTTAENSSQVINALGAQADNTSIWFIVWGDRTCHALYPQGTMAGLSRKDLGEETKNNSDGSLLRVMREQFTWDIGLSVRDWRYVARIANIDVSSMNAGSVPLYTYMRNAYYQLQQRRVAGGRPAIYCNRDVLEALDALGHNAGASDNFTRLRPMEIEGKEVMTYRGIPIRETDALINAETLVA
jgi:hypothetical protein